MQKPTFNEALKFWIQLGFISFGGPAGQIAIMHEFVVHNKKWISDSKFMHALNYCMILPGPEAQQLATYIGWMLHGVWGGIAAGIFFVLPSMFIMIGLSTVYVIYGSVPWIGAIFVGLKPAVIAIVFLALVRFSQKSLTSPFHSLTAMAAFIGIFYFNISFPIIILCTLVVGICVRKFFPSFFYKQKKTSNLNATVEDDYFINNKTLYSDINFRSLWYIKPILTGLLLWSVPFVGFYFLTDDFPFWKDISFFFTKAAFVTFGGAYAVLPYVAQVSVEKYQWLTSLQMMDGLALGETTPGPLVMILTFVGFMAGYNHFGSSLALGVVGLLTTTFYTFLPCFIFIFVGAPLIERTQENHKIKEILSVVTAAVVGVVLNLTIYLSRSVFFPSAISLTDFDMTSFIWSVVSFIALYFFKMNMIIWIGVSALFGLAIFLV